MAQTLALDALFEEHRRFLWGLCYRMTGNAADADDVVQDTFLRVIEHPPQRIDEPLRPWLVKVTLNRARDLLRHRRRREYVGPYDRDRQTATAAREHATGTALVAFLRALEQHDVAAIESLLAEDARTTTAGGGEFRSALLPIVGREKVMRFYLAVSANATGGTVRMTTLNGVVSAVIDIPSPAPGIAPRLTLTAELNARGKIAHLYVVSAPRKLTAI